MSNRQKVTIITGAEQGVGESLVSAYREHAYRAVTTSRSIKQGSDDSVHVVAGDISSPERTAKARGGPAVRPSRAGAVFQRRSIESCLRNPRTSAPDP
jgi:NAD(P)-dependent dehydrogenase (short-subunit alcohol dehydrogenase family)